MGIYIDYVQVALLIGIAARLVFSKYFEEKGKNLATKQDIRAITEIAESVKLELQQNFAQNSDWKAQNKLTLINFFDEFVHWTEYSIKNLSFIQNNSCNPLKIRELISELNLQRSKVERLYWRVILFETDPEFTEMIKKIFLDALDLHTITFDFLLKSELLDTRLEASKNAQNIRDVEKLLSERGKVQGEFIIQRDKKEVLVNKEVNLLMNLIRKKLQKIMGNE